MGASKYQSRSDLLRQKATGLVPEVDAHKQALFDRGHAAEAAARVLVEELIGDELSPITALSDDGTLLASLDGATLMGDVIFEHKLWSEPLAAQVRAGELEPHYYWQLEQQLAVSGAEKVVFVTSDGTREKFASMEYRAVPGRREELIAAWKQFDLDLAGYVPPEVVPAPVAKIASSLPVVFDMRVEGKLVSCNLEQYKPAALAYIAAINTELTEDQHFADATTDAKFCRDSADKLELAVEQALGQMGDINTALNTVREIAAAFDAKALVLEKKVTSEKAAIKERQMQRGKDALAAHIAALNTRLGKPYMPPIAADFAGKIKNLRTVESLRNAIDTELARAKIEASATADRIDLNLRHLRENAAEYAALFPDTATIVLKAPDDLQALVSSRISTHQAAEQKKEAETRERIAAEERQKLEREQAEAARQVAQAATPAPTPAPVVIASPAPSSPAAKVVPMRAPAESSATIRLGQVNDRLAPIQLSAAGMAQLGFKPCGKEGAAVLYRESDLPKVCHALIDLLGAVAQEQRAA